MRLSRELIISLTLSVACGSALAQGTLNFANAGAGWSAAVTDFNGLAVWGSGWEADLYWATGVVTSSDGLERLGAPATFSTVPSQAGLFFGGTRTVPTAPGVITAQVRAWDAASGSSWEQASATPYAVIGASILFNVTLAETNATPTSMTGLSGFPVRQLSCLDCGHPPILQPPVKGVMTTNTLVLVWPTSDQSPLFSVQQNTDLNTTNWTTLTNWPVLVSQPNEIDYQIFVQPPSVPTFYRLKAYVR